MKLINLILLCCVLTACDGSNSGAPAPSGGNGSSGGLMAAMATGVASGVGMAAGHHMINGAVNKWREHRENRAMRRSMVPASSGFRNFSRRH